MAGPSGYTVLKIADRIYDIVSTGAMLSGGGAVAGGLAKVIKAFIKRMVVKGLKKNTKSAIKSGGEKWVLKKGARERIVEATHNKLATSPGKSALATPKQAAFRGPRVAPERASRRVRTRQKAATRGAANDFQRRVTSRPSPTARVSPGARQRNVTKVADQKPIANRTSGTVVTNKFAARQRSGQASQDAARAQGRARAEQQARLKAAKKEGADEYKSDLAAEVKRMKDAGLDDAQATVAATASLNSTKVGAKVAEEVATKEAAEKVTGLFGSQIGAEFARNRPVLGFPIKHPFATAAITTVAGSMIGKGESPEDTALQHQMLLQNMLGEGGGEAGTVDKDMIRAMRMMRLAKMMEASEERVEQTGGGGIFAPVY